MIVYYVNHLNEKIDLSSDNIILQYQELFDYSWDADVRNNKISRFLRLSATIPVTVAVTADTWEEYLRIAQSFYEVIEKDILDNIPGKLYVGDYYISCYISGDKKVDAFKSIPFQVKNLSIVTDYPFWIKEKSYTYRKRDHTVVEDDYLDYPFDYSYDYSPNENARYIENEESPGVMKAVIQGPCVNPSFKIAGNQYQIMTELTSFEYIVLDGFKRTVYKVSQAGSIQNVWNSLNKDYDNFAKVPNGEHIVEYDGSYTLQIVLYQERSEPKWTM